MTSTDFTTGFGENPKPSSKVLRPPGGGSTDIFGPEPTPQTPRSVKNHMASNIFGNHSEGQVKNSGDCGRRVQKNVDSYSRLFGEPDRPFTPAKNHMRSNIPIGQDAADGKKMMNGNGVLAAGLSVANCDSTMNANAVRKENARMENAARMENRNGNGNANGTNNAGEVHNGGNSKTDQNLQNGSLSHQDTIQNGVAENDRNSTINVANITASAVNSPSTISSSAVSPVSSTISTSSMSDCSRSNISSNNDDQSGKSVVGRNPVTGHGVQDDPFYGRKSRKLLSRREGNPITGEGYKPAGTEINTTIPCLNGANQVINKNRIPPGGFSSGLW